MISIDVPVRGVPSARLAINVPHGGDVNLARVAGGRCIDILSLALLQRMPPGLKEVAGTALLRAVSSGSQPWRLKQLSPAAGIPAAATVVAVVVRTSTSQQMRAAMDKILKRSAQQSASYVDNSELLALAALPFDGALAARAELVAALRELPVEAGTMTAVGPLAAGIEHAPWSLSEAKCALDLAVNGSLPAVARPCRKPKAWCSTSNTSPWSAWRRSIWTRPRGRTLSASSWDPCWTTTRGGTRSW